MYHEHPIKILRYCIKNLWLLIFPLLRSIQLFPFSTEALVNWFVGAWFDILIFLLILGFAFVRWYCCRFDFNKDFIRCQNGVFVKRRICIPCDRITASTETHLYLLRPIKLIHLRIDTGASALPLSELCLWLRKRDLVKMHQEIPILRQCTAPHKPHRPGIWLTLLFSFLFSSSLSGTVYIIAFFTQAGSIAKDLLEEFRVMQTIDEINDAAIQTFHVLPAIVVTICIFLGACWLLSFLANLLHYGRFHVHADTDFLSIHMGIFIRRRTHLRPMAVHYVISKQNLIMKLFGVQSIHLSCPGYGNGRKSLPVLIPVVTKKSTPLPLSAWMPEVSDKEPPKKIRGRKDAIWSFVWTPVLLIGTTLFGILFTGRIVPGMDQFLVSAAIIVLIPSVWLLLIRLISIPTEYVAYNKKQIHLHYSKGFSFYTIAAPIHHIIGIKICKTPMTSRNDICNIYITLRGHHRRTHRILGVSLKQAEQLLRFVENQK